MRYPQFLPNPELLTAEARIYRPGGPVAITDAPLAIGRAHEYFGLPGPVPLDAWEVLDHVIAIVQRITPWATVYVVPALVTEFAPDGFPHREIIRRRENNKDYVKLSGVSISSEGLIALSLFSWAGYLISTAYHEAWHQLERILDKNILDDVDAHLIPLSWGSAYLDSISERRARAFETWCMRFEEGMPNIRLSSRLDEIFEAAATGDIAIEWQKQQKRPPKAAR